MPKQKLTLLNLFQESNQLTKITITSSFALPLIRRHTLVPNVGIPGFLELGVHLMDVLKLLGNPNKEFYLHTSFTLNYFNLGLDLIFCTQISRLIAIIAHSNCP